MPIYLLTHKQTTLRVLAPCQSCARKAAELWADEKDFEPGWIWRNPSQSAITLETVKGEGARMVLERIVNT